MHYFFAIIFPPLAVWLSEARRQVILSVIIWGAALYMGSLAHAGILQGAYAAGPVLYIGAVIHAFIFVHRKYQRDQGQIHPHRGTAAQAPPPDASTQPADLDVNQQDSDKPQDKPHDEAHSRKD